jgi:hypothetical protein
LQTSKDHVKYILFHNITKKVFIENSKQSAKKNIKLLTKKENLILEKRKLIVIAEELVLILWLIKIFKYLY